MKKTRVVKLTEAQLREMVKKMISEQGYEAGVQAGMVSGKATQQKVKQGVQTAVNVGIAAFKGAKEALISVGKFTFTAIIFAGYVTFKIGETLYKVSAGIGNAILSFLASSGKAVVKYANQVGQATVAAFEKLGANIKMGAQAVAQWLGAQKDKAYAMITYVIGLFKQFGVAVYGKMLVAAANVKEFGSNVANWAKTQYNAVAQQLGVAWDTAVGAVSKGVDYLKQKASQVGTAVNQAGQKVANYAKGAWDKASNIAGKGIGFLKGLVSEFFVRFIELNSMNSVQIINEWVTNPSKVIL
jgi:hypothetical protein